jgi:hypothetical protein
MAARAWKRISFGSDIQEQPSHLQSGDMLWPLLDIHPPQPDADGARRDDDDLVAILPQPHCRFHYRRQDGEEGLMRLFVDDGAGPWDSVSYTSPCLKVSFFLLTQLDHHAKRPWSPHGCEWRNKS